MNEIEPTIDIDKQQIITLFNNNVKGHEICLEGQNDNIVIALWKASKMKPHIERWAI